ncbi:phospholipid scramblase 1-like isoform X2 [Mytilus galloprovincialis]|uniref:phospholipid scramblase 1-like isoform X2 n=1 Tax=Mytilus galloprovincialis TaxID=29158 RepID=UPI003F7BFAC8
MGRSHQHIPTNNNHIPTNHQHCHQPLLAGSRQTNIKLPTIKTNRSILLLRLKNAEETADLGKISKKPGMAEIFTDENTFGANFPMNLDVKAKVCVLGAVFLIDFMFFEGAGNKLMSYN